MAIDSNGGGGEVTLTWGYTFGGLFYFTKPLVEAGKNEGYIEFAVGRAFGYSGRVRVDVVTTNYVGDYTAGTYGVDYFDPVATLAFDDYEMLKTFQVPIINAPFAGDPTDTNAAPVNPNYYFGVQIVAVRFDPQENTNLLAAPAIMTGQDTSVGRMLELDVRYSYGDPGPTIPELFAVYTNVMNFAVKRHITSEYVGDGDGNVHIWVTRNGFGDPAQTCQISWAINSLDTWGDLRNNIFLLSPESDYATPTPETTPDMPIGALRAIEFVADAPGDWAFHCHKSHHVMNAMGHDVRR